MKKTTLFFLFIFLSVFAFSQTDNKKQRPKDIKDNPEYLKALEMEKSRGNANIQVSEYFGLESKITSVLVNDVIPSIFPKSLGYTDKNKYIETINSWLKNNQGFVKTDKKTAVIAE
jgi:hypothetical protein